jgi:hypothetical protein
VSYEQDDSKTFLLTYRGGVQQDNTAVAVDTRTQAQKNALLNQIIEVKYWLHYQNPDGFELRIMGKCDYDFGSFPFRIKENPCFDVVAEYGFLI